VYTFLIHRCIIGGISYHLIFFLINSGSCFHNQFSFFLLFLQNLLSKFNYMNYYLDSGKSNLYMIRPSENMTLTKFSIRFFFISLSQTCVIKKHEPL
jgi:hypothetical protein